MSSHTDLQGLRVAVTGGTSGLGLALVQRAQGRRRRVAFVARTAAAVQQTAREHRAPSASSATSAATPTSTRSRCRSPANLGGLDVLINNASSLGPVPLALLADTACEDLGAGARGQPHRRLPPDQGALGALAASAREGRGAVVVNISSDAAVNAYPGWGAYGASKAALAHLTAIWGDEAAGRRRPLPLDRPGRHGHAAARAGRSRMPTRRR